MRRIILLLVACAASPLVLAQSARADDILCGGIASDSDLSGATLGTVIDRKLHFVLDDRDKAGCPSADKGCLAKAYLQAKDQVVVDKDIEKGAYICAMYVNKHGEETDGWLPLASLKTEAPAPHWIGRWKRDSSADIEIKSAKDGKAEVDGEATWGTGAATHEGSIDGTIDPGQPQQSFASDGDKQVPYEQAGEYDCAVRLAQVGPYLLVSDNDNCGGANVSFSGVYTQR